MGAHVSTTLADDLLAHDVPPGRRRIWLRVTVAIFAVVGLAVVGSGIGAVVYAHTYQPLSDSGGLTGLETPKTVRILTDGINRTAYAVVGPSGTRGVVLFTVSNYGAHPVQLEGIAPNPYAVPVITARWAPANAPGHDGKAYEPGLPSESRAFPVTVPANGSVLIELTVMQPNCGAYSGREIESLPMRWMAFGVHHLWAMPLTTGAGTVPIAVCPPRAAIRRAES